MTRVNGQDRVMRDDDDVRVLDRPPTEIMSPAARAEVDIQIATARRYPRNVAQFKDEAMSMATIDEDTAAGCFYALPRGGKPVEGPSARLAEIMLSSWGNVRADARVIEVGEREIVAEGMCWDLEKNIAIRVQVRRRITDKHNRRYNDDMIVVTGNAACSIALRNAVFKVIPMVFTRAIYAAARQVAIGDAQTLAAKRANLVDYFAKMGVTPDRVCAVIERPCVEEITLDDLGTLRGLATAIKDGDTTIEQAFPSPATPKAEVSGSKSDALAAKIASTPTPAPATKQPSNPARPPQEPSRPTQ